MCSKQKVRLLGAMVVFAVLYAVGCSKVGNGARPINSELKKYFSYKQGTYWVYIDSITRLTDSFYIAGNFTGITPDNNGGFYYEVDVLKDANHPNLNVNGWTLYESYIHYTTISDDVFDLFQYPYSPNAIVFPTYVVNGIIYNNVLQTKVAYYDSSGIIDTDLYLISTDAGIIKMNLNRTDTSIRHFWNLLRYKIIH